MYPAKITATTFFTTDGAALPLRRWLPTRPPQAVMLALHGFNDYSMFFDTPAQFFSAAGIACYAFDQRGFGRAPQRGYWAGSDTYIDDVSMLLSLLKQQHPGLPIFLLGESMGGAIALNVATQTPPAELNGIILAAPAVWARSTMPWYQTSLLWTLAHTVPWMRLSGKGLGKLASDNIEMLRAMGRDPLIIKETRVEAIYGLADLMDQAYSNAQSVESNTLLLYGEKDEILPKEPVYAFIEQLLATPTRERKTVNIYDNSYHILLRDLGAKSVWQDILSWMHKHTGSLSAVAQP